MQEQVSRHIPVMKNEVLEALKIRDGGFYIDATFGAGGHSRAILEKNALVLALDRDSKAVEKSKQMFDDFPERFSIKHTSFAEMESVWSGAASPMKVDGVILDLGFSSDQIEDAERGFSFQQEGPLDMRFDLSEEFDARVWINRASKEEMTRVFEEYGQEKNAYKIAKAIVKQRKKMEIQTTHDLVKIINEYNEFDNKHSATRIFQAIRIHVNDEFTHIRKALVSAKKILKHYGRLAVLTFHSLEDKIVKDFFENEVSFLLMPSEEEITVNARSRSAKLRWMIKTEESEN